MSYTIDNGFYVYDAILYSLIASALTAGQSTLTTQHVSLVIPIYSLNASAMLLAIDTREVSEERLLVPMILLAPAA